MASSVATFILTLLAKDPDALFTIESKIQFCSSPVRQSPTSPATL